MSRYDLYEELDLDRSKSPAELAAELDHSLKGVSWDDKAQHEQLTVARRILGNPIKRQMYDQRLADPNASIDIDQLRGLAYQDVKQPPASLGALSTVAVNKVKSFYRTDRTPKLAGTAVAAVAVLGLVGAGVASCGGDDSDDGGTGASGTSSSDSSAGSDQDIRKEMFEGADHLEPGEEVEITTGKAYTYDDGREERVDSGVYGYTVDNFRLVDEYEPGDSQAPDDHPDAQPNKLGTYLCYDEVKRLITENDEIRSKEGEGRITPGTRSKEDEFDWQMQLGYPQLETLKGWNVIDASYEGEQLGQQGARVPVEVPPGSTDPLMLKKSWLSNTPSTTDESEMERVDYDERTITTSGCQPVVGPEANDDGRSETELPDNVTGFTVSTFSTDEDVTSEPSMPASWRYDL